MCVQWCVCVWCRDDIEWGEEQKKEAEQKVTENSQDLVPHQEREEFDSNASLYWDNFYQQHQNK